MTFQIRQLIKGPKTIYLTFMIDMSYAIGGTDVDANKNKAIWKHLASLVPKNELGNYDGKVQDTVEVLDINKWKKSWDK